nr:ab hydrolase superfamily protein b1a11.02 [Quercus suber]
MLYAVSSSERETRLRATDVLSNLGTIDASKPVVEMTDNHPFTLAPRRSNVIKPKVFGLDLPDTSLEAETLGPCQPFIMHLFIGSLFRLRIVDHRPMMFSWNSPRTQTKPSSHFSVYISSLNQSPRARLLTNRIWQAFKTGKHCLNRTPNGQRYCTYIYASLDLVDIAQATGGADIDIGQFPDIASLRQFIVNSKLTTNAKSNSSIPNVSEYDKRVEVRDGTSISCRIYRPQTPPSKGSALAVIYHGGGWCVGGVEEEELLCRLLASKFGMVAINVDYRLAPEHRFPIAVTDSFDATLWATKNASSLGADPSQGFIIGGTSAGGNIAAVIAHLWRDEGLSPSITGQHLMIPLLVHHSAVPKKYRAEYQSYEQNKNAPILSGKAIELFSSNYISLDKVGDPFFSPLLFPTGHGSLPPAYFQVCGQDPLRDEALIYERILREDEGIETKVDVYPGLPHGFWAMMPKMEASKKFVADSLEGWKWLLKRE